MKKTISQAEHVQIVGLLTLAEGANKRLKEIEAALIRLVGTASADRCCDAVFCSETADEFLENAGIKVRGRR